MVKFEKLTLPAAGLGEENPMPDIKNVSYIHAGYKMTPKISENEKTHIGKGMINTMLPYRIQDGYDRKENSVTSKLSLLKTALFVRCFFPNSADVFIRSPISEPEKSFCTSTPCFSREISDFAMRGSAAEWNSTSA